MRRRRLAGRSAPGDPLGRAAERRAGDRARRSARGRSGAGARVRRRRLRLRAHRDRAHLSRRPRRRREPARSRAPSSAWTGPALAQTAVPGLRRRRAELGDGALRRPLRRRRERRAHQAADPDRRRDRDPGRAGRGLVRGRCPRPPAASPRGRRRGGRRRRLPTHDPGGLDRRGRAARADRSTRCRSGWRASTAPARSSSPTPRTSCARRSSRWAASSSCSRTRSPTREARAEFVSTMREQIARLEKLTADLLDLSKLDADAMQLHRDRVHVGRLAERVGAEFAPAVEAHGSRLDGRAAPGRRSPPPTPDRLAQILRILIDNALTHTPKGTAITITTEQGDGTVEVTVRDDGPGIDPHDRDRVFERFYTGDELGGSGLGLAIARELAVRMGGDLGVLSHRGRTEFTVRLPAAAPRGAGVSAEPGALAGALAAAGARVAAAAAATTRAPAPAPRRRVGRRRRRARRRSRPPTAPSTPAPSTRRRRPAWSPSSPSSAGAAATPGPLRRRRASARARAS